MRSVFKPQALFAFDARHTASIPRRWQQALISVWAMLILAAMYERGLSIGIDQPITSRLRYHAIPVAMSVLYHGRQHDYTAYRSLALGFQARPEAIPITQDSIEARLAWAATSKPPKDDATHYWAADDRGMADYVIGAFALFGPHVKSLYAFYFVVLGASVLLLVLDIGWHRVGGALLIFALVSVYTCLSVIPLGNLTVAVFENGVLYEPRLIELLAFVATVHLGLAAYFDDRWTTVRVWIVAAQALVLAACYHMRSSVGWEVAFVLLTGAVIWARRTGFLCGLRGLCVLPRRHLLGRAPGSVGPVPAPPWPIVCVSASLLVLAAYRHEVFNSRYFQDLGGRTVWHNALMGLGSNGHLNGRYNLRIDDELIVHDVISYLRQTDDSRLTPEFLAQIDYAMSSLGGQHAFDWVTYEKAARDFYSHIWRIDTRHMLHCYLIDKPRDIGSVLLRAWQTDRTGARDPNALYFRPLAAANLVMILPALLLLCTSATPIWPSLVGALVLVAFSAVPGLVFYPVVHTMIGMFASIALVLYLVLATALDAACRAVRSSLRPSVANRRSSNVSNMAEAQPPLDSGWNEWSD
jgi:hypothetical protein